MASICQHGFVVRDVQGPNRFLCKECDERFLSYPQKDKFKPEVARMPDPQDYSLGKGIGTFSEPDYIWAKGVPMTDSKIHVLPLSDKVVESTQFMGDDHE